MGVFVYFHFLFHSILDYFNILFILELNSEFRDFKIGYVLKFLWNISERLCDNKTSKILFTYILLLGGLLSPSITMVVDSILETALGISIQIILLQKNSSQIYFIVPRIYLHCTLPNKS